MSKISLKRMHQEVQREVAMRKAVYPRQVASGKMTTDEAEERKEVMGAIGRFLEWCMERQLQLRALQPDRTMDRLEDLEAELDLSRDQEA